MILQYCKKINLFRKIILKQKLKANGFPYIKVDKQMIKKYRETTNKNRFAKDNEIEFKIVRAFYSGHTTSINDREETVEYGYLTIKKDKEKNLITYIQNNRSGRNGRIDFEIKDRITAIYVSVYGGEV